MLPKMCLIFNPVAGQGDAQTDLATIGDRLTPHPHSQQNLSIPSNFRLGWAILASYLNKSNEIYGYSGLHPRLCSP